MQMERTPWRLGHRGACGYAPENTLLSFQTALDKGVDGIEFDIQLSREGVPVIIHDDRLERTTNGTGQVRAHSVLELKSLDAGMGHPTHQTIPTLEEAIAFVAGRCRLFIELKAEGSVEPVVELLMHAVMHQGWSYEQFYLISFDHHQIAHARELCEHLRTSALFVGIPLSLAQIAQEAGAWSINPGHHHLSRALVEDAHRRGLRVLTWTVNSPHDLERVQALGVDGIFSDFPDRL